MCRVNARLPVSLLSARLFPILRCLGEDYISNPAIRIMRDSFYKRVKVEVYFVAPRRCAVLCGLARGEAKVVFGGWVEKRTPQVFGFARFFVF